MSDYDRNVAAFPRAGQPVAVDAGLRAHMLTVYNYMAVGVALTGVVAYLHAPVFRPGARPQPGADVRR